MFPFECRREDRPWFVLFAAIALIQAMVQAVVAFRMAGGHFMLPLDDAYIHLQYARRALAGAPLVYTPGAGASGGMTSPLFVALLMPGQIPGLGGGVRGALFSYLFGTGCWMLLPIWIYQLTMRLSNCLCGALAAGLCLAHGHLVWNFLSGMETGLFTLLVVGWCLAAITWSQGAPRHARWMFWACLAMLPLTRPEGAAVFVPAALLLWWGLPGQESRSRARRGVTLLLALVPFLAWLVVLKLATGDWRPAGLIVKGLSAFPYYDLAARFAHGAETLSGIVVRFYGNQIPDTAYAAFKGYDRMPYVAPGLALLAAVGAGLLLVGDGARRRMRPGGATALVWLLGTASLGASLLPFIHQQRYLAPWTPLMIVLAVLALRRAALLFAGHEDWVLKAGALGLLLLSLPSVPWWMAEYGRNSRDIYHVLRVSTFPLQGEEPGHYALTDAGALAYYTDHRFDDFVGLTSAHYAHATLHGEGATLEALAHAPQRPTHLISYREWFSDRFPVGEGEVLAAVPRTSITSGITMWRMPLRGEMLDPAPITLAGGAAVALHLNVAHLPSERAAGYRRQIGIYDGRADAWPQPLAPVEHFLRPDGVVVADGGRVVRREEFAFTPPAGFAPAGARLLARVATPRDAAAPHPRATALRIGVQSRQTGFVAWRIVELPVVDAAEPQPHAIVVPMGEMIDEAGGLAWTILVEAAEPDGACWASFQYVILSGSVAAD